MLSEISAPDESKATAPHPFVALADAQGIIDVLIAFPYSVCRTGIELGLLWLTGRNAITGAEVEASDNNPLQEIEEGKVFSRRTFSQK